MELYTEDNRPGYEITVIVTEESYPYMCSVMNESQKNWLNARDEGELPAYFIMKLECPEDMQDVSVCKATICHKQDYVLDSTAIYPSWAKVLDEFDDDTYHLGLSDNLKVRHDLVRGTHTISCITVYDKFQNIEDIALKSRKAWGQWQEKSKDLEILQRDPPPRYVICDIKVLDEIKKEEDVLDSGNCKMQIKILSDATIPLDEFKVYNKFRNVFPKEKQKSIEME